MRTIETNAKEPLTDAELERMSLIFEEIKGKSLFSGRVASMKKHLAETLAINPHFFDILPPFNKTL